MQITVETIAIVLNIIGVIILFLAQKPLIKESYTTYFWQEEELKQKNKLLAKKELQQRVWSHIAMGFIVVSTLLMIAGSLQ